MEKWILPGWSGFPAPQFPGSPSEMQLFREIECVPFQPEGRQLKSVSFSYRTEQPAPDGNTQACPPPGTIIRFWIANRFGEILAQFQPVPIQNRLNFAPVVIPFPWSFPTESGIYYGLLSCTIPSGEQYTGLILRSCYGLVPPTESLISVLPGVPPSLAGQRRYRFGSNPALDGLGPRWPDAEDDMLLGIPIEQVPLITFEEA